MHLCETLQKPCKKKKAIYFKPKNFTFEFSPCMCVMYNVIVLLDNNHRWEPIWEPSLNSYPLPCELPPKPIDTHSDLRANLWILKFWTQFLTVNFYFVFFGCGGGAVGIVLLDRIWSHIPHPPELPSNPIDAHLKSSNLLTSSPKSFYHYFYFYFWAVGCITPSC